MFKQENRIWWYIIGLLLLLIAFYFFYQGVLAPFFRTGQLTITEEYTYLSPPKQTIDIQAEYQANFFTSEGIIVAKLYPKSAPKNVNNFIFLAREGYYDGTKFHRVFPDFLIQGGDRNTLNDDPTDDGLGGPGYVIEDEVNWDALDLSKERREKLRNLGYSSAKGLESKPLRKNSLAMANAGPNTNGSQFFMVIADRNDPRVQRLNGRFTVIGHVVSGGDVISKISRVKVDKENPNIPRPKREIVLRRVEIIKKTS